MKKVFARNIFSRVQFGWTLRIYISCVVSSCTCEGFGIRHRFTLSHVQLNIIKDTKPYTILIDDLYANVFIYLWTILFIYLFLLLYLLIRPICSTFSFYLLIILQWRRKVSSMGRGEVIGAKRRNSRLREQGESERGCMMCPPSEAGRFCIFESPYLWVFYQTCQMNGEEIGDIRLQRAFDRLKSWQSREALKMLKFHS